MLDSIEIQDLRHCRKTDHDRLQPELCPAWAGSDRLRLPVPSNFFFAASPDLAAQLEPIEQSLPRALLTRDGDGPIHL